MMITAAAFEEALDRAEAAEARADALGRRVADLEGALEDVRSERDTLQARMFDLQMQLDNSAA